LPLAQLDTVVTYILGILIVAREEAEAQLDQIGGTTAENVLKRARAVERAIYSIGASLLPPDVNDIPPEAREPYQPFEAIREIEINWNGEAVRLRPLIILDDVHTLHPQQFESLFQMLTRREMKVGRWMMMRMDALSPSTVFRFAADSEIRPDPFRQGTDERGAWCRG
jgi:hypothetical protein